MSRSLNSVQKKKATVLRMETDDMVAKYGEKRMLTLMMSFADPYPERKEAQRRFHSLKQRVLKRVFECYVWVFERSAKGRPHYHLVGAVREEFGDVKGAFDFETLNAYNELNTRIGQGKAGAGAKKLRQSLSKRVGESATPGLKLVWDVLNDALPRYQFGRSQATPVMNGKATAVYYAKYLVKDGVKREEDTGHRDYGVFGKRRRVCHIHHQDAFKGGYYYRASLRMTAFYIGVPVGQDFKDFLGPRWHYHIGDSIQSIPKDFVKMWLKNPEYMDDERLKDFPVIKQGLEALEDCMKAFMRCYTEECMYIQLSPPTGRIAEAVQNARAEFEQTELPLPMPPDRVGPTKLVSVSASESIGREMGRGSAVTVDPLPTSRATPNVINTGLNSDRLPL